jgi:hypothetical protein
MPKWVSIPTTTASSTSPTIMLNFTITIDYGEPEVKALIDMIGDNENYYMTAMPFPVLKDVYVRGDCQFYNRDGDHLDGDGFTDIKLFGVVMGWKGEPQTVMLHGSFQIGTFCQSGNGHLKVMIVGGPLDGQKLECDFTTINKPIPVPKSKEVVPPAQSKPHEEKHWWRRRGKN